MERHVIFVTGGTGYMGRRLIPLLAARGHTVRALVRPGSESRLPEGCQPVVGNALDGASFAAQVPPADTFIHLVGVAHPSPSKGEQFRAIDLKSIQASVPAAVASRVQHFIYVSVAQPAPIMGDYIAVRSRGEALLRAAGLTSTILRPWYVLGPGHRWPWLLVPIYWLFELFPGTRASARRLGLVTLSQMLQSLVYAVERPPTGIRVVEVPEIRQPPP